MVWNRFGAQLNPSKKREKSLTPIPTEGVIAFGHVSGIRKRSIMAWALVVIEDNPLIEIVKVFGHEL